MKQNGEPVLGFSAVEILAVLFIVGILAAIVIPRLSSGKKSVILRKTAEEIGTAVELARSYSQSKNENYEIGFYETTGKIFGIQVGKNLNLDGSITGAIILDTVEIMPEISVSLNNQLRKIIFQPHNSISLKNRDGAEMTTQNAMIRVMGNSDQFDRIHEVTVYYHSGEYLIKK